MTYNIVLAGVGGQGVLTVAHAISHAAQLRGYKVKQSEVHGMSQRGGAVTAHLRLSDGTIHSGLIPLGEAHMVLSVEPLETLRYVEYLAAEGTVVSSTNPFPNIPDYPPVDAVLERIAKLGDHVLINSKRIAQAAGSIRAENTVMLGAASASLALPPETLEEILVQSFSAKGARVVEANRSAFRMGRRAAELYRDGLVRGHPSRMVMDWIDSQPVDRLLQDEGFPKELLNEQAPSGLTATEEKRLTEILRTVRDDKRLQLLEHEVYFIMEWAGAINPPRHRLIRAGEIVTEEDLRSFHGDRLVLKIESPDIIHKSDIGGVVFVAKKPDQVNAEVARLIGHHVQNSEVRGVLAVEFVEESGEGLGRELFVGIRQSREFGAVIAAGLGGVDTEYLAAVMRRGAAVAQAPALNTTPGDFFTLFQNTAAYELLAGKVRGHKRVVTDAEFLRCFRTFLAIARRFCVEGIDGLCLEELEINPFGFLNQKMVPLDGRGRLGKPMKPALARPVEKIRKLLEPRSIGVVGVSEKRANFGQIILENIRRLGFPTDRLFVVKKGIEEIDGVPCIPGLKDLSEPLDLLVSAVPAQRLLELVQETVGNDGVDGERCSAVILIPGALGEKQGSASMEESIRTAIHDARRHPGGGPVFLGGNCMGVRSRPGRYDTFFVPESKLNTRPGSRPQRLALISQSGAFIITRLSNLESLDPNLAISVGNQIDITVADILRAVVPRDDIDCIGVYVEGFNELDGARFVDAVQDAVAVGKVVVFYKAGRTPAGRTAAQGHTASIAGDYDVCDAALVRAGAIVVDTFKEFEQLVELATRLHHKQVGGLRLGVVTNAGCEAVGAADSIVGSRYRIEMAKLAPPTSHKLAEVLSKNRLEALVDAQNPLDITAMADDAAYEACIKAMIEADEVDAVITGCVPMSPQLRTLPEEVNLAESIGQRVPRLFHAYQKPLIFVVDCSGPYDELARVVRAAGVPVFRSIDQAVRSVARYVTHRHQFRLPNEGCRRE